MSTERLTAWGDELREVHHRLREALAVARESVEDSTESPHLNEDLLLFCRGFCVALSGHHRSEDRSLFPRITEAHPELAPVIAKLSQDHSMIDYLIAGFAQSLNSGATAVDRLRHLDGIEAVMESHFLYEERQLVDVLNAATNLGEDKAELFGPIA